MSVILFTEKVLEISEEESTEVIYPSIPNTPIQLSLHLLPSAVMLYSMELTLSVEEEGKCALIWLGTDRVPILVSSTGNRYEIARTTCTVVLNMTPFLFSSSGKIKKLSLIHSMDNLTMMSPFVSLMQKSMVVTAAILASTAPCVIRMSRVAANISTQFEDDEGVCVCVCVCVHS